MWLTVREISADATVSEGCWDGCEISRWNVCNVHVCSHGSSMSKYLAIGLWIKWIMYCCSSDLDLLHVHSDLITSGTSHVASSEYCTWYMWSFSDQNCGGVVVYLVCSHASGYLQLQKKSSENKKKVHLQHLNVLCHEVGEERPSTGLYSVFTLAFSSAACRCVWPHKSYKCGTSTTWHIYF